MRIAGAGRPRDYFAGSDGRDERDARAEGASGVLERGTEDEDEHDSGAKFSEVRKRTEVWAARQRPPYRGFWRNVGA